MNQTKFSTPASITVAVLLAAGLSNLLGVSCLAADKKDELRHGAQGRPNHLAAQKKLHGHAKAKCSEQNSQAKSGFLELQRVESGISSGISQLRTSAIQDSAAWNELWKEHTSTISPAPKAPSIDFKKQTALAVFAGNKNTGGYKVTIQKVERTKDGVRVTVVLVSPGKGDMTAEMITQPFDIVSVEKITCRISWEWR
jgi:hypothetical protein